MKINNGAKISCLSMEFLIPIIKLKLHHCVLKLAVLVLLCRHWRLST